MMMVMEAPGQAWIWWCPLMRGGWRGGLLTHLRERGGGGRVYQLAQMHQVYLSNKEIFLEVKKNCLLSLFFLWHTRISRTCIVNKYGPVCFLPPPPPLDGPIWSSTQPEMRERERERNRTAGNGEQERRRSNFHPQGPKKCWACVKSFVQCLQFLR